MREIKFRAWNKIEEKMVYYDKDCSSPDITLNGVCIAHQDQSNVSYIYILMQFTGLKDKSGTEIYEGDILPGQWVVMWWPEQAQFVLGNGSLDVNEAAKEEFVIGLLNRGVVIGNRFQNPDLLEKSNNEVSI